MKDNSWCTKCGDYFSPSLCPKCEKAEQQPSDTQIDRKALVVACLSILGALADDEDANIDEQVKALRIAAAMESK